jgi:hypothetical protein
MERCIIPGFVIRLVSTTSQEVGEVRSSLVFIRLPDSCGYLILGVLWIVGDFKKIDVTATFGKEV